MKKKGVKFYSILSILMSFLLLICAGWSSCNGGGSSGDDAGDMPDIAGTKVLSRPADYSFADAVGEFSENYYNLYARDILNALYYGYEESSFDERISSPKDEDLDNGFAALIGDKTYGKFVNNEQYYLYDSIRYTINKVEDIYNSEGTALTGQVVSLNLNDSWNWKVQDVAGASDAQGLYFKKLAPSGYNKNGQNVDVTFSGTWLTAFDTNISWELIPYPNFSSAYVGNAVNKTDTVIPDVVNYYSSPFYGKANEADAEPINYFQDAMEYAIYMFVLGYDYHTYDEDGKLVDGVINAADAPYFNFHITYGSDGFVSGITVDGWGNNVPITEALQIAKDRYAEIGGYVGVVEKNLEQIKRFILEKVIGENSSDVVNIARIASKDNGGGTRETLAKPDLTALEFNRNYDAIVNNIVRYACEQAPIGYSVGEDGSINKLTLSNGFSASMITEYKDNYFFANYINSNGENDDSVAFKNIDAAEYQSLVIYPGDELIGEDLSNIWLDFEYFENNDPSKKMFEDGITINVGFRYYDHIQNKVVVDKQEEMKIAYGKNGTLKDENGEDISDQSMFLIGDDEDGPNNVHIEPHSVKFRKFNNDIGGGVLNPFAPSIGLLPNISFKTSKYLSGLDRAREYYKLNDSKTLGQYGTLNEKMFAGSDGCSFIEIYFDIVKDPSVTGYSYDFKVCFRNINEFED